jgi:hypothetical protein
MDKLIDRWADRWVDRWIDMDGSIRIEPQTTVPAPFVWSTDLVNIEDVSDGTERNITDIKDALGLGVACPSQNAKALGGSEDFPESRHKHHIAESLGHIPFNPLNSRRLVASL